MKRLIAVLLLIVSTPTFAAVGDKYICDTLQRPYFEQIGEYTAVLKRNDPEKDWADGLYVNFFVDWESEKSVQVKRVDIWKGEPSIFKEWKIPISNSQWGEVTGGFLGRKADSYYGDHYISFNSYTGILLFVTSFGFTGSTGGLDVDIWHLKCVKTKDQSVEEALITLEKKNWPKRKNKPKNIICNLKTLSPVGIYFAGGESQSSDIYLRGAMSTKIFEFFLARQASYELMLIQNLQHELPMLKIYGRGETPEAGAPDVGEKNHIYGSYSCGIWTVGDSENAIGLNVSCNLLVHDYNDGSVDFPVVEAMRVVSRENLDSNIIGFLKALTTESVLAFYKARERQCQD